MKLEVEQKFRVADPAALTLFVDGLPVEHENGSARLIVPAAERRQPARFAAMVVAIARSADGRHAGAWTDIAYKG